MALDPHQTINPYPWTLHETLDPYPCTTHQTLDPYPLRGDTAKL